jgi:hypothetical protein
VIYTKTNTIIIAIITLLIGAGAGFFGGMKYQQTKRTAVLGQFGQGGINGRNGQIQRNGNGNAANFRPVSGQIISTDNGSITVKMSDGSSKIVLTNDKTVINQTSAATASDLKTGENVAVFGTANSDGSVTATNIEINPQQLRVGPNASPNP